MAFLARVNPEEPLAEHLREVGRLSEEFLTPLCLGPQGKLAGLCHDLGKATPYFQEMLQGKRRKGDPLTWHALPGALFAAWTAREQGLEEDALLLFLAVLEHHGSLSTPWARLPPDLAEGRCPKVGAWSVLPQQLEALNTAAFRELVVSLGLPDPVPFLKGEACKEAQRLALEAEELLGQKRQDLRNHFRLALLYSALLDADRRLAGQAPLFEPGPIPPRAVEAHLAAKRASGPLSPHREALFQGLVRALDAPLERLFPARLTLTAPTGAGKTLAALRFALGLRERVGAERGFLPKVVYALPYIAIADQVEEEARDILAKAGLEPEAHLLVHHHLALARLRQEEAVEEVLALQETWDRNVVITTFHQVFHALVGPGSSLRPLHALAEGAILILDEVQTLPAELWPLLRRLLRELPGNVTVVSMTATQPRLVEGEEIAPALPDYPARVRLAWGEARTLEALAEHLLKEGPRPRLVVLNTVREAVDLYRRLKEGGLPHLHLLTSHLIPKHRKGRLEAIRKALAGGVPLTLVATQVVEAGVDLDFQEGYRALAPLESLLQAAGRVNRNGLGEGRLWVLDLEGESGKKLYGAVLLDRTRRVLGHLLEGGLEDREAYRFLPDYYRLVEEGISQAKGQEALEALAALDYDHLEDFRLLEDVPSLPIFVEWDEEATHLLRRLEEALDQKDPKERRKSLRLLLPRLQAYTVSPLLRRALKNLPPPLLGREDWRHVSREAVADFYDKEVGFVWEMEQFL